ncbi:MAG: hypothetical protein E7640_05590 [Ruminococcaceae bacterium]|nr:hypothetical protein [Oscillospiraceae bacterium]
MDNKIPENDIKVEGTGAAALENFWYYHKWKVIVSLFVAFVIGVCVWSCFAKPKIDISLLYVGSFDPMDAATQEMTETLSKIEPSSVGTNGVGLNMLSYYTEEQAKELAEKSVNAYIAEENKNGIFYDEEERLSLINRQIDRYNSITADTQKSLGSHIGAGNYLLYLLDPAVYEAYRGNGVFVGLSSVFGDNIPLSAYSYDAIKLCETALYKNDPNGIGKLPKDTLICLRIEPVFGGCGGSHSEDYEKAVEMFKIMAE